MDQLLDKILFSFVAIKFKINTKYPPIVKYNAILVKEKDKLPKTGAFKLTKFLTSN
jgi:hypothetical protein